MTEHRHTNRLADETSPYLLQHAHNPVDWDTSGEEALRAARTLLPDLGLLDMMLPGMDGLEICRHLKQDSRTRHLPVVMVTAVSVCVLGGV